MTSRRILLYCQHLTGLGHYIRAKALAHGLADAGHDVTAVVGGPPVPEEPWSASIHRVMLPVLRREEGRLASPDGTRVEAVFDGRRAALSSLVVAPFDLCIVEHFPFGKWEMRDEIVELLRTLRRRSGRLRVVCSVRDATDRSRFDISLDGMHSMEAVVRAMLGEHFDEVWVHGDPGLFALESHLSWLSDVGIPVRYTGYVVPLGAGPQPVKPAPEVVVSGGGGRDGFPVLNAAFEAWHTVKGDAAFRGLRLVACCGPYMPEGEFGRLRERAPAGVVFERSSPRLNERIFRCILSIGRAGYNSCVAALAGNSRMILAPSADMSDQRLRADALAERAETGVVVIAPSPNAGELVGALRDRMAAKRPAHDLRLDGARVAAAYAAE